MIGDLVDEAIVSLLVRSLDLEIPISSCLNKSLARANTNLLPIFLDG